MHVSAKKGKKRILLIGKHVRYAGENERYVKDKTIRVALYEVGSVTRRFGTIGRLIQVHAYEYI